MIKEYCKGQHELVTLQKYSGIGSQPFYLIGYRDPCLFLQRDLALYRDAEGTDRLSNTIDFFISGKDALYGSDEYEGEPVISTLTIINPEYYTGDIYITYKWIADYASAEMFNRFDRGLDQMINSIVLTSEGNPIADDSGNLVVQGTSWPGFREEIDEDTTEITEPPQLPLRS